MPDLTCEREIERVAKLSLRKYLIAEYCPGPFYMGWWMYLRDRNDGSDNDDGWESRWGWMRCHCLYETDCHCDIRKAHDFCASLGAKPPMPRRFSQAFAEWFAGEFPGGLLVEIVDEWGNYKLVEKIDRPPKQVNRGIIRTVRRADASRAKRRAADRTRRPTGARRKGVRG